MLLSRAVNAQKITKPGLAAFYAAVDPFHDKPIEDLIGWPDMETAPSVVRKWKDTFTVKSPEDGAAILITHDPIALAQVFYPVVENNGVILQQTQDISQAAQHAPVCVYTQNATTASSGNIVLENNQVFFSSIPYLDDGPGRLLGLGIEVRDVTADLYKQGTITCFEIPQTQQAEQTYAVASMQIDSVSTGNGAVGARSVARAPATFSEIMSLPTTTQWDAREGAYVVVPFTACDNVPALKSNVIPAFSQGADADELKMPLFSSGAAGQPAGHQPNLILSTRSRGMYLTGLNVNSTFTITIQYYWESFPKSGSTIRTLASPSAPFDPRALALISLVTKDLPIATPVGNNASGDWFWEIVQDALPLLGGVASALFPEFSPLIMPLAATGSRLASERLAKSRSQQKEMTVKREQARVTKRATLVQDSMGKKKLTKK